MSPQFELKMENVPQPNDRERGKEELRGLMKQFEREEQRKSIDEIFESHPELEKVGSREEYENYVDSIFPDSTIHRIMWHGTSQEDKNKEVIYKEGFKKEKSGSVQNNMEFYGFYFADRYNYYGGPRRDKIAAVLDIKKPRIIDNEHEKGLSSLNVPMGVSKFYNLKDEDGIIQIGTLHLNDNIPEEEHDAYDKRFDDILKKAYDEDGPIPGFMEFIEEVGLEGPPLQEVAVFKPEQIHILGTPDDINSFQEFVSAKKGRISE